MTGAWTIRDAVPSDAAALARLAERTFRDAFSALNTPADIELHCATWFGEVQQLAEIRDPVIETLIVDEDRSPIAFAQLHRGPAPPCVEAARPVEIRRFYLDREWRGTGLAKDLMAECTDRAAASGADAVWLGVWELNPRAIAFYAKRGFIEVGEHTFKVGNDPQRDLVLVRAIDAARC